MAYESQPALTRTPSGAATPLSVLMAVPWDQESGGVASVVGYLGRYLETSGHRVLFLHPGVSETPRYKKTRWGFDGVELNLRNPFLRDHPLRSVIAFLVTFPFTLFQLLRILKSHRVRVVNIHYPGGPFVYFAFCRWLMPIRLVVSIHGTDVLPAEEPKRWPSPSLRLLLRAADLIIAPSWEFLRLSNRVLASVSERRKLAIHNGIDPAELESRAPSQEGEAGEPFILSIASHDEWKGLDILIGAIGLLRDERETVRLVLAGDGPARPQLESLTAALGLQRQVQFIGYQSRSSVARLLNQCTLFVLPSRSEPFGIVIIEALACGKPVVATAVGGITEIIEDGTTGILVAPEDPGVLAAAIRKVLSDARLRQRLGQAGRRRVRDRFQWQRMGETYTNRYQELCAHGA